MVNTQQYAQIAETNAPSLKKWYCRFGHIIYSYFNKVVREKVVNGLKYSDEELNKECEACA